MTRTYVIQVQNGIWADELVYSPYYACKVDASSKEQAMEIFSLVNGEQTPGKHKALSVKSLGKREQEWIEYELFCPHYVLGNPRSNRKAEF